MELIVGALGARGVLSLSRKGMTPAGFSCKPVEELFSESCESLRRGAKSFLDHKESGELYKISFVLEVYTSEDKMVISRWIKVAHGRRAVLENSSEARFLMIDNKFLKVLKNGKKQRFIPSRNGKNISDGKKNGGIR